MRKFAALFFALFVLLTFAPRTYAIEDPLAVPNNKFGISILFTSELSSAASLIDTNGGDWGYVTIPLQVNDRDPVKWQAFMDQCKQLHLIPIIRLATEGDGADTRIWRKPTAADIVDFSTFLNGLRWPTKNRYIIVFNEINRYDEWGGSVNPAEYANLLSYSVTTFKSKSRDFFLISAGLDNAAPNQGAQYMDEYDFMKQMDVAVPGVFNQVDGLASHSYPNPAFAQPPSSDSKTGTASFTFERSLAESLGTKKLPVFITETGWSSAMVSNDTQAAYYQQAINTIWNDPGIVAITPFLLNATNGPFQQFSFTQGDGTQSKQYIAFKELPKAKGSPALAPTDTPTPIPTKIIPPLVHKVLAAETTRDLATKNTTEVPFFAAFFQHIWGFFLHK
jgi:hypothetical protein